MCENNCWWYFLLGAAKLKFPPAQQLISTKDLAIFPVKCPVETLLYESYLGKTGLRCPAETSFRVPEQF
jgi:hypothetical protein